MKFEHPTVVIDTPAEGHYVIKGHAPRPALTESGYLVPPDTVYISPECPTEALEAIIADRKKGAETEARIEQAADSANLAPRRTRGRRKAATEGAAE